MHKTPHLLVKLRKNDTTLIPKLHVKLRGYDTKLTPNLAVKLHVKPPSGVVMPFVQCSNSGILTTHADIVDIYG
jgi:hypothetical protein